MAHMCECPTCGRSHRRLDPAFCDHCGKGIGSDRKESSGPRFRYCSTVCEDAANAGRVPSERTEYAREYKRHLRARHRAEKAV